LSKHKTTIKNTSTFTFEKPFSTNPPEYKGIEKPKEVIKKTKPLNKNIDILEFFFDQKLDNNKPKTTNSNNAKDIFNPKNMEYATLTVLLSQILVSDSQTVIPSSALSSHSSKKPVNNGTSQSVPHNIKNFKYNTIPYNFKLNSIYLVDVSLEIQNQLTLEIINTLILRLKFIPILDNHLKNLITRITVYSQYTKQILNIFVQELKKSTTAPKNNVYFFKDQKAFHKLKKSQFWFDLHKAHVLFPGDKNTGLCIVSINWVTKQSKKHLHGNDYKTLSQANKNSYFLSLNLLFKQYCNQIKVFLDNLYRAI
jgi:hypothetical protein